MVKKLGAYLLLLMTCSLFLLGAAENPVVKLNFFPISTYSPSNNSWLLGMSNSGTLSIKSKNSGNVRGEIALTYPAATAEDYIQRAFLKARFPSFRLTLGKTRLSWGEGALFNAGDVLFGSSDIAVDLTQEELRTKTDWLVSVNIPLDAFSFIEVVTMPPSDGNLEKTSFGGRFYTTIEGLKVEGGYASIERSNVRTQKPYVSVQGNMGADWYLGTSLSIPQTGNTTWDISGGLFYLKYLQESKSLSVRLEFLARPLGTWAFGPVANDNSCALLIYPEIVYAATSSVSFSLRSIFSPLDLSAMTTFATSWNVFEGFTLAGYLSTNLGDTGDLFVWNSLYALTFSVGASWIF
ncbi:hypothetical protein [uncultured Sphaerochaeta sp.]|uniref:hypothetical protein n=1 Tax=uncultured Sphaerochaeta sp. TaxID=886478 RepID=UPI002A0A3DDC|nr:hypothetical protein [uncultured Sphaerochaeta sp.]